MDYSKKVLPILRKTREALLASWGNAQVESQKDGSAVNVVTKQDVEIEERVSTELAQVYPNISFVGEEHGGNREASRFWIMDPIDGTQHFVRGLPFCTSMIALIENGVVTFSAIYDFVNDDMYWAERGRGAFCNGERLQVSNRTLAQGYIGYESNLEKEKNLKLYLTLRKQTVVFQSINAGWEYAMVASGKLDARICLDPYGKDYDYAPGSLLVSEAGGIVANIGSTDYDYRNTSFIAANPAIYKDLTSGEKTLL